MEGKVIQVILSSEAENFVRLQSLKTQQKIAYNIRKLECGVMDKELFKKLENSEIWELRTLFNGICYRLFAFWDTDKRTLVVATHGIIKKTSKIPKKEIEKAESIRKEYFNNKKIKLSFTPSDKLTDDAWGKIGTPARDAMEEQLKEEVQAYFVGEAIKNARLKQHLTQEELGERIGVKRSQICKLENGNCSITLSTMRRVFKALGITTASLDLGIAGKVTLW